MNSVQLAETLTQVVLPIVESEGLFLEEVAVKGKVDLLVRITVDLPDGTATIDSDQLQTVSRAISDALDEADLIENEYNLEVSSPGAERKLTTVRHYERSLGRLAELTLQDKRKIEGYLRAVNAETITVEEKGVAPKPGMKPKAGKTLEIPLAEVSKARLRVDLSSL